MEFGKKIGWARGGLLLSAVLLAVMGVLCFVAHDILPEALHNPSLPEGYTWPAGELIMAAVTLIAGVCLLAAYNMAGASRTLGGWIAPVGILSIVWAVGAVVDPWLGTFSFEWVEAVFIGLTAVVVLLSGFCGGRVHGYKGWAIECLLGLVMLVCALAIVMNSAYSATWLGVFFFAFAIVVAAIPTLGATVKIEA